MICFATLEVTFAIFLRQSLAVAGYEGVRTAVLPGGSTALASVEIERILEERRVKDAIYTFSKSPETAVPGEMITLTISAPSNANSFVSTGFLAPSTIAISATMVRE